VLGKMGIGESDAFPMLITRKKRQREFLVEVAAGERTIVSVSAEPY
jgi:hypothetical protein